MGGCSAEDSLEHYARCPEIWEIAGRRLRVRRPGSPSEDTSISLGLQKGISDDLRLKMALLVHCVREFLNYRRHHSISADDGPSFIWQAMKNGARGHQFTEKLLDQLWAS